MDNFEKLLNIVLQQIQAFADAGKITKEDRLKILEKIAELSKNKKIKS